MTKENRIAALQNRAKILESRGPHNTNIVNKIKRRIRILEKEEN